MKADNIFWLIFLAIIAFLILSRSKDATDVLDIAGGRFMQTIAVLQGRTVEGLAGGLAK